MRIDMTTRELHCLLGPVLPHASTDKDDPTLCVVRLEAPGNVLYAIGYDRYTLGAERWPIPPAQRPIHVGPIHVRATDAAAALKLFGYDKDLDPPLRLVIDTAAIPIRVAGTPAVIDHLAITIESDDGTRLVLHDVRDPSHDPLARWRDYLAPLWARPPGDVRALALDAGQLAKWGKSVRRGERLTVYAGNDAAPLLVLGGEHFAGSWVQVRFLDTPAEVLAKSPWLAELDPMRRHFDRVTGEATTLDDDPDTIERNTQP